MAAEVSSPPVNARTIRFTSLFRVGLEPPGERGGAPAVARDRRLRRVEAALVQPPPELFLAMQRFAVDDFEDDGLAARFHRGPALQGYTKCIRGRHDYSSICVDFTASNMYKYAFRCIRQFNRGPRKRAVARP